MPPWGKYLHHPGTQHEPFHFDGLDEPLGRAVVEKSARFLAAIPKEVRNFRPDVVVVDPVSNFLDAGATSEAEAMLVRRIDLMKSRMITGLFTNLVRGGIEPDAEVGIPSIIDTAITLRNAEHDGDWSRVLRIVKSRGMPHSRRSRYFQLTSRRIEMPEDAAERRG